VFLSPRIILLTDPTSKWSWFRWYNHADPSTKVFQFGQTVKDSISLKRWFPPPVTSRSSDRGMFLDEGSQVRFVLVDLYPQSYSPWWWCGPSSSPTVLGTYNRGAWGCWPHLIILVFDFGRPVCSKCSFSIPLSRGCFSNCPWAFVPRSCVTSFWWRGTSLGSWAYMRLSWLVCRFSRAFSCQNVSISSCLMARANFLKWRAE